MPSLQEMKQDIEELSHDHDLCTSCMTPDGIQAEWYKLMKSHKYIEQEDVEDNQRNEEKAEATR